MSHSIEQGSKIKNRTTIWFSLLVATAMISAPLSAQAAQPVVNLGNAETFAVLAGSGITNTGPTTVSGTAGGDLGSHPTPAFVGSELVTTNGTKYLVGEPAVANAKTDLLTAYNDAAGRIPANSVAADLGGQTLVAGVYNSASSLALTGSLNLDAQNDPDAVFIFQAGSTLTTASNSVVNLINGAQACNVFWQVGSSATFGTTTSFVGSVLALTSITATTGATFNGQLLAINGAVTLDTNTIINNSCIEPVVEPEPEPEPEPVVEPEPEPEPVIEPEPEPEPVVEQPEDEPVTEPTPGDTPEENDEEVALPGVETPDDEQGTVDGGILPDTGSNSWFFALILGALAVAIGTFGFIRARRAS